MNKVFDEEYESTFISIYKANLKGVIDRKKIIEFNEKTTTAIYRPFKIIMRTFLFLKLIKQVQPDKIITIHDDANTSILPTILIYKKILSQKKIKFYLRIRTNPTANHSQKTSLLDEIVLRSYKNLYKYADVLLVQTEKNKYGLSKKYPKLKSKIKVIPNIYDSERNKKKSQEKIPNSIKKFISQNYTLITVWRQEKPKWQRHLLRVFASINEQEPNTRLIIIWGWNLEKEQKCLAKKLQIEKHVRFTWAIENPFSLIAKADCFILTSLREGMPQVVTEALSLGKTIIATDCDYWPREILCPELTIHTPVKYPYTGSYGTLTQPFPIEKPFFETITNKPLTVEEKKLEEAILQKIRSSKTKKHNQKKLQQRAMKYDQTSEFIREHIRNI